MNDVLYGVFGAVLIALFAAWVFAKGSQNAVWLCLFLLPFRVILPPSIGGVLGFQNMFLAPDVLVPVTFVLWYLRRVARPREIGAAAAPPLLPRAMLLVAAAFLLSYRPGESVRAFASELEKWAAYGMIFILVSQELRDRASLVKAVNVLLVAGVAASLRDLPAYFHLLELPPPFGYVPNRDAFLVATYHLERYQGTGWPFFVYTLILFIFARLALLGPALARRTRWALGAYGGLLVALLILSLYRGDWLALAAALLVSMLLPGVLSPRTIAAMLRLGAVTAVLVAAVWGTQMVVGASTRLRSIFNPMQEEHVLARLDAYAVAWDMFRARPLTGIGLGQFGGAFEHYGGVTPFGVAVDPSYFQQANSDYFQYIATTGLAGLGALGVLFGSFLRRAYRLLKATRDDALRAVLLGCLLSTVGFLTTSLSQDPTWDKTYGALMFAEFGMIWAAAHLAAPAGAPAAPVAAVAAESASR